MALPDLTGQNIQDTYQRVLQVSSSGDITDGTGSLVIPPNAVSASYALSASHEIIKEVSSSHADTASYIEASNIDQPFTDIVITNPSGTLIPGDGSTSSIAVTVVNDGQNRFALDGVKTGSVTLVAGNAYRFDTSDSSNLTHPFAFQVSGSGASYTTGVTVNGDSYSSPAPGEAGAYVQISVTNATPRLIYYCTSHGTGMGGETVLPITTGSLVQSGSLTITGSFDLQSGSANIEGDITAVDITASGNITSSGIIRANIGLFAGNIEVDGDIHADNNIVGDGATNIYNISSISASGNISGSDLRVRDGRFSRDGFAAEVEIIASETAGGIVGTNTSDNLILRRFNVPKFTLSESRNFSHQDLDVQGDISSSGTSSMAFLNVGGGVFTSASLANAVAGEGETYDLNADIDGSNVDLNLTSTTGTDDSVVQFTAGPNITLTTGSSAEIIISASSGGSGFPFSGSAVITGSLTITGSTVNELTASHALTASFVDIGSLPLVNPIVEYFSCTALTASGTTVTLPNNLTFVSSSQFEYIEVFFNGLRLRYDIDFIPQTTESIRFEIPLPSGSELTYKSLQRP